MKIVLIGHGAFGNLYRQRLQENLAVELVGMVEADTDRFHTSVPTHAMTLMHLIDNLDFDAVVIATPPQAHHHDARHALMSGKHVFCAKPCTLNLGHFMELQAIADSKKLKLYVDYTMLAAPEQNTLDQLFGALGDPRMMESRRMNAGNPRPEGIVHDLLCHDIATFFYHFPDTKIASVECEDASDGVEARLYNEDDRLVCSMLAAYEQRPDKRVTFHTERVLMMDTPGRIDWDQIDRTISVESRIGDKCFLDFMPKPDPISLSIERFVSGYYEPAVFTRTAAICEMLNEARKKAIRVEAP